MVDKIKAQGIKPEPTEVRNKNALAGTNSQTLKENFKSISSSLSAAQVFKGSGVTQKDKVTTGSSRLSDSLQDAVKYSKQALKVLEDVTAGSLNSEGVDKLLSEEETLDSDASPQIRDRLPVSVEQLAGDLEELKNNLTNLFESLKNKANQSVVSNENQRASQVDTKDLEQARLKANSTSLQIQFDGNKALSAHRGPTLDSVALLLGSRDAGKI